MVGDVLCLAAVFWEHCRAGPQRSLYRPLPRPLGRHPHWCSAEPFVPTSRAVLLRRKMHLAISSGIRGSYLWDWNSVLSTSIKFILFKTSQIFLYFPDISYDTVSFLTLRSCMFIFYYLKCGFERQFKLNVCIHPFC